MSAATSARSCPDAEQVAAFIEGRLDPATRADLEHHVAGCAGCLDVIAAVLASDESQVRGAATSPGRTVPPPKRGRRRLLRGAVAAGLAFAVTATVAYVGARVALRRVASEIASRAAVALGEPVDIGGLRLSLDTQSLHLGFDGLAIGEATGRRSSAEKVEIALGLAALANGRLEIERVRVVGVTVHVMVSAEHAEHKPLETRDLERIVALAMIGPLELVGGHVVLDIATAAPIDIDAVQGTITPERDQLLVALAGTVRRGGDVHLAGTVAASAGGDLDLDLRTRGVEPGSLPFSGRDPGGAATDLAFHVSGTVTSPRITSAPGSAARLVPGSTPMDRAAAPAAMPAAPGMARIPAATP